MFRVPVPKSTIRSRLNLVLNSTENIRANVTVITGLSYDQVTERIEFSPWPTLPRLSKQGTCLEPGVNITFENPIFFLDKRRLSASQCKDTIARHSTERFEKSLTPSIPALVNRFIMLLTTLMLLYTFLYVYKV